MATKSSGRRKSATQQQVSADAVAPSGPAEMPAPAPAAAPEPARSAPPAAPVAAAPIADPMPLPERDPEPRRTVAMKQATLGASVANDDRWRATARVPDARAKRSSNLPFFLAAGISPLWVAAAMGSAFLRGDFQREGYFVSPDFVGLVALSVLPVLGTFAIASLNKRARDLRETALTIAEASRHLSEPETSAKEVVASVAGAVRREMEALDQGVGRALSRASEIESMLHNEVAALERTSSENERRMRMLVTELASQREALTSNTERTREVITESHSNLIFEMYGVSQRVSDSVMEASNGFAQAVDYRITMLSDALSGYSASFARMMTQGGMQMLDNLYAREKEITTALEDVGARMADDITSRASDAEGMIGRLGERLNEHVQRHVNDMESRLNSSMIELTASIEASSDRVRETLAAVGAENLEEFEARAEEVKAALEKGVGTFTGVVGTSQERITEALDSHQSAFVARADELETTLETRAQDFTDLASRHTRELAETLAGRTEEIAGVIGEKSRELSAALDTGGRDLVEAFDSRTSQLSKAMQARQAKLSEALGTRTQAIETLLVAQGEVLEGYVQQVAQTLDERSARMKKALAARTGELDAVLDKRGRELDETLERGVEAFSAAITGRGFEMARTVETSTLGAARLFEDKIAQMGDTMARGAGQVAEQIARSETEVLGRLEALATGIDERGRGVVTAVEDSVTALHDKVRSLLNDRLDALPDVISARADAATGRLSELNSSIEASLASALGSIEFSAGRIQDKVGTGLMQSMRTIAGDIDTTLTRVDGTIRDSLTRLQETSRDLDDQMLKRAADAAAAVSERALEVNRALARATGDMDRVVSAGAGAIEQTLASHASVLEDAVTRLAADADMLMDRSTTRLTERAVSAIAKVAETTSTLNQLVESSGQTLSEAERVLAEKADSYAAAVRQAAATTAEMGRRAEERAASIEASMAAMRRDFAALQSGRETPAGKAPAAMPVAPVHPAAERRETEDATEKGQALLAGTEAPDAERLPLPRVAGQNSAAVLTLVPKAPAAVAASAPAFAAGLLDKVMARSSNAAETLPAVARRDSADLRTDLLRETLGNLFAQAAKSQEPQDGENSLGRLAERLAATIDNEALSQAWRRYQGGEKLGADTSFYSPAGRTVFEILERRVTQDAGFADQARRVVDAFEPQLKACRNEADPLAASLRLLLTEKGKVYVALAHVLGRLG